MDHLNYSVYAKALAHQIEETTPPLTIGIFARWGGGKSHLMKHIKDVLERKQRQSDEKDSSSCSCSWRAMCCFRIVFLCVFVSLISTACLWSVSPSWFVHHNPIANTSVNGSSKPTNTHPSRFVALAVLFFCVMLTCVLSCCSNMFSSAKLRLIFYATFTKLPNHDKKKKPIVRENLPSVQKMKADPNKKKRNNSDIRYIFVNFNAWEYAGSDTLWAGIVTNLSKSIEAEFGMVTSRLFRLLNVDTIDEPAMTSCKTEKTLYVNLPKPRDDESIFEDIVKEHGAVKRIEKLDGMDDLMEKNWWLVEYSHHQEAHRAYNYMKFHRIEATLNEPRRSCDQQYDLYSEDKTGVDKEDKKTKKTNRCALIWQFIHHFVRHPKTTCGLPNLFWWLLFYASFVAILWVTVKIAKIFNLDIHRLALSINYFVYLLFVCLENFADHNQEVGRAVPVVIQVLAWTPPAVAVLYVLVSFVWAMFHSQRQRIQSALKGTKGNVAAQLGFMNKVKTEVQMITKLVKCAEFTQKSRYKVVIFIDDLDRVEREKVKAVLEAVSILLSDPLSSFVCLIAVDSRVAVNCIENTMCTSMIKSNVNGQDYLKKIINLPFCLPEINHRTKAQYICGLITLSDETRKRTINELKKVDSTDETSSTESRNRHNSGLDEVDGPAQDLINFPANDGDVMTSGIQSAGSLMTSGIGKTLENEVELSHDDFAVACRDFFYRDDLVQKHLDGNLRSIKRIYNVLSLTLWVLRFEEKERNNQLFLCRNTKTDEKERECSNESVSSSKKCHFYAKRDEQLARDLVTWVVLVDQWPFRISYLLQIIEDSDYNPRSRAESSVLHEAATLFNIYDNYVLPELEILRSEEKDIALLSLDVSPNSLYNYLNALDGSKTIQMNKGRAKQLKQLTISLDQGLKQTTQRYRAKARSMNMTINTNKLTEFMNKQ